MNKVIKFYAIFTIVFILILTPAIVFKTLLYISRSTNTPLLHFPQLILNTVQKPTLSTGFNFVLLGIDPRNDLLEKTEVSDTIIIGRLTPTWQVKLISIPRDLWVYSLNTKVNQIYPLSLQNSQNNHDYDYIQNQFSSLTGQQISKTIMITSDNLIELTKIIGGVDITLQSTYTDKQYPNPDYVQNPNSKAPIYKTVVFPKGANHLDESNITEFVRSRKGQNEDGSGGTDLGRIYRQQLLLDALLSKIKSNSFLSQPNNLISLYNFWHQSIVTNISDQDLVSLALEGKKNISNITLLKSNIPAGEDKDTDILYHPSVFQNSQWVYLPQDKEYLSFHDYISSFLKQ